MSADPQTEPKDWSQMTEAEIDADISAGDVPFTAEEEREMARERASTLARERSAALVYQTDKCFTEAARQVRRVCQACGVNEVFASIMISRLKRSCAKEEDEQSRMGAFEETVSAAKVGRWVDRIPAPAPLRRPPPHEIPGDPVKTSPPSAAAEVAHG